ncbi:MAG: glycine dehydrogenase subunit 2 [Chloroflexi bacterium]|nr:glycine dehydrogenase subunit 2 [Chloroflexota bacterium]
MTEPLLRELSRPGRPTLAIGRPDVPATALDIPEALLRDNLPLPEVGELEVVRHFTRLSQLNFSIDTTFYPLGSCTMKYNPKVNDAMAALPGMRNIHPLQPEASVQGALQLIHELQDLLAKITGFDGVSLTPAAGAHGELAGMLMIRAAHEANGDGERRRRVIIPDSAHGTNPATAAMAGYQVSSVRSDARGNVDLAALRKLLDDDVAGLMITVPSTLGLFDEAMLEVSQLIHEAGGLVYGDGANLNALLGIVRPRELGLDLMHSNLHKTFTTPHGGGGPGASAICATEALVPFLPLPVAARRFDGSFYLDEDRPQSIGRLGSFQGHFGMLVRAYTYIRMVGADGLHEVSEAAVLNANYLRQRLSEAFNVAYDRACMHEVVLSGLRGNQVRTIDVAKRLLDYGVHPPTIYFPLVVPEALMIEPTETETKATLDAFVDAMLAIAEEAERDPELARSAPHTTPIGRLDETAAARNPVLHW